MGCAWYRKVPYILEEKPKGYIIVPRQNQKRGQNRPVAVCTPIREAAIKIYCMHNPDFIGMEDVLARFILGMNIQPNSFYTPLNGR